MTEKEIPVRPPGVLDRRYHHDRLTKRTHAYRLKRRTEETLALISAYTDTGSGSAIDLLDIGTADGLMLSAIRKRIQNCRCFGLDYSLDLIRTNGDEELYMICGDASLLPFRNASFNVLVACAVIEHLSDAGAFLEESFRVLKEGGILILTTPVPFWEKFFSKAGHLKGDAHQETFDLTRLKKMLISQNFEVPEYKKFMISPVGFPFETVIEDILRTLRLSFTFGNQIIIGKKNGKKKKH